MQRILVLLMMTTAFGWAAAPELRGVWVDRGPLASRESIAAMMENLKEAHFNAVFVDVWSRGYPLWQSAVFERHTGLKTDPAYGERDVLAEAIEEGKARGLAVIPWLEYGFVIGYTGGRAPMVEAHPDWLAKRKDGTVDFAWAGTTRSYWMAHSHPEAQKFLMELMLELGANYDVPAIQFDRARYPEKNCGYDETTKALYAAGHDGAEPPADENDEEWGRWRAGQINGFVAEMNRRLKAANWRMLVTNAPIVFDYSYRLFLQDYPAWMRAGSMDFVSPQVYRADAGSFERELDRQLEHMGGMGSRMAPGVDISNTSAETLVREIGICRERNMAGVVIWYYGALVQKGALARLRETVFSEPAALPWR